MSDMTLEELADAVVVLAHEMGCHKCALPSDEGLDNVVAATIDLLWPKASRMMSRDGWVLTREGCDE